MKEANHTPGPWNVIFHGKAAYVSIWIGKEGLPASAIGTAEFSVQPYIRPAEAEANARLIAAAPELLAALEGAYREIKGWRRGLNHRNMNKAKVGAEYIQETIILQALRKARSSVTTPIFGSANSAA